MPNLILFTCFIIFAFLTALAMLIMGYIFSYKNPHSTKSSTYECGLKPEHTSKIMFNIKYLNNVIMFLIFDVALIFIYPILSTRIEYSNPHLGIIIVYLLILLTAILHAIKSKFIGEIN